MPNAASLETLLPTLLVLDNGDESSPPPLCRPAASLIFSDTFLVAANVGIVHPSNLRTVKKIHILHLST